MKRYAVLALTILGSGCSSSSDFHPTKSDIDKVEAALARSKCVGDLDKWRRTYVRMPVFTQGEIEAARKENRMERLVNFDKRMIEFTLHRANGRNIIAGRAKLKRPEDFDLKCSEPDCLLGGYAIPRNELYLECEESPAP